MATTGINLAELSENLSCKLCNGYLIDATTLTECCHSFCHSCLWKHLKTSNMCPICKREVFTIPSKRNFRKDQKLQDLVYAIVPGLYKDEMDRRKEFYSSRSEQPTDSATDPATIWESICLRCFDRLPPFPERPDTKTCHDIRYLSCQRNFPMRLLQNFIKRKYLIPEEYEVHLFIGNDKVPEFYLLKDVVDVHGLAKSNQPLCFNFYAKDPHIEYKRILERKPSKKRIRREKKAEDDVVKKRKLEEKPKPVHHILSKKRVFTNSKVLKQKLGRWRNKTKPKGVLLTPSGTPYFPLQRPLQTSVTPQPPRPRPMATNLTQEDSGIDILSQSSASKSSSEPSPRSTTSTAPPPVLPIPQHYPVVSSGGSLLRTILENGGPPRPPVMKMSPETLDNDRVSPIIQSPPPPPSSAALTTPVSKPVIQTQPQKPISQTQATKTVNHTQPLKSVSQTQSPKPASHTQPPKTVNQAHQLPTPVIQTQPPKTISHAQQPKPVIQTQPPKTISHAQQPKPVTQIQPPKMETGSPAFQLPATKPPPHALPEKGKKKRGRPKKSEAKEKVGLPQQQMQPIANKPKRGRPPKFKVGLPPLSPNRQHEISLTNPFMFTQSYARWPIPRPNVPYHQTMVMQGDMSQTVRVAPNGKLLEKNKDVEKKRQHINKLTEKILSDKNKSETMNRSNYSPPPIFIKSGRPSSDPTPLGATNFPPEFLQNNQLKLQPAHSSPDAHSKRMPDVRQNLPSFPVPMDCSFDEPLDFSMKKKS